MFCVLLQVFLLGVKSHFVQHLAANILVVISELSSTSVCQYIIFYFVFVYVKIIAMVASWF